MSIITNGSRLAAKCHDSRNASSSSPNSIAAELTFLRIIVNCKYTPRKRKATASDAQDHASRQCGSRTCNRRNVESNLLLIRRRSWRIYRETKVPTRAHATPFEGTVHSLPGPRAARLGIGKHDADRRRLFTNAPSYLRRALSAPNPREPDAQNAVEI